MQVLGYVPSGARRTVDCARPLRAVCRNPACGHVDQWACGCSSSAKCGPCSDRVRRHYARVIEAGLSDAPGHAYFLTLTAPGENDHLRWFQGVRPAHRPACSCHLHGLTMSQWNSEESTNWNRLRTALARLVGSLAYAGAVEMQKRGALHRHLVLRTDVPLDHAQVQALALEAGYGCTLDLQPIGSAAGMGRYLSKYVTKGGDRENVPWERTRVDTRTGEVTISTTPTYRLRSQSHSWGVTMRDVRAVAGAQARARGLYLRELHALLDSEPSRPASGSAPADEPSPAPP